MNDLAAAKSSMALADGERALELLAERMRVLAAVDGGGESRLMGFLHFKAGDLFCLVEQSRFWVDYDSSGNHLKIHSFLLFLTRES